MILQPIGAVTAMHDALALANLLYAMPTGTTQDVTKVFDEYKKERLPAVMEAFNYSQGISKVLGRGIFGAIYLYIMTHMPTWLWRIVVRVFACVSLHLRQLDGR